jgi:hypothetical protein
MPIARGAAARARPVAARKPPQKESAMTAPPSRPGRLGKTSPTLVAALVLGLALVLPTVLSFAATALPDGQASRAAEPAPGAATARVAELEDALARRTEALALAEASAERYRALYEEAAPAPVRRIVAEAMARIQEGLSPQRIAFVVSQAGEARACGPAVTRHLPAGARGLARVDDLVSVAVERTAADEDPGAPVTATFAALGADPRTVTGPLPLSHALVARGMEYRFLLSAGAGGGLALAADACEHPGPPEPELDGEPQADARAP